METFLTKYLDAHVLEGLSDKAKGILADLETQLKGQVPDGPDTFDDIVKLEGAKIADLITRISAEFKGWTWSWSEVKASFCFVLNISTEVHQMVEEVQDKVVKPGSTPEQAKQAKIDFGTNLVYFIWMTLNPLKNTLNWVPLKGYLQKRVVIALAHYGLQHAFDVFSVNRKGLKLKAI